MDKPKKGDRVVITAVVLPSCEKEFIIVGKVPDCELYQLISPDKIGTRYIMCDLYAGETQFKIINN